MRVHFIRSGTHSADVVANRIGNRPNALFFRNKAVGNFIRLVAERYRFLHRSKSAVTRIGCLAYGHPRTERCAGNLGIGKGNVNAAKVLGNVYVTRFLRFVAERVLRRINDSIPACNRRLELAVHNAYANGRACIVAIYACLHVAVACVIVERRRRRNGVFITDLRLRHFFFRQRYVYHWRFVFVECSLGNIHTKDFGNTEVCRITGVFICRNGYLRFSAGETLPYSFVIGQIVQVRNVCVARLYFHIFRVIGNVAPMSVGHCVYRRSRPIVHARVIFNRAKRMVDRRTPTVDSVLTVFASDLRLPVAAYVYVRD